MDGGGDGDQVGMKDGENVGLIEGEFVDILSFLIQKSSRLKHRNPFWLNVLWASCRKR